MNKNTVIGILAIVILALAALGYFVFAKRNQSPAVVITEPVTTTHVSTPVTPAPVVNRTPAAPAVITSTDVVASISTALVTGKVIPNGASTTYWFEYGTTASLGSKTSAQAIGSGYTSVSAPGYITNLRSNTTYYVRLVARSNLGTVNGDTLTFKTNTNPAPAASIPTAKTLAATGIARTSADLQGQVNPSGLPTSYWFEYGTSTNLGFDTNSNSLNSGSTPVNVTLNLTDLNPLTRYYYRVIAQNQYGTVSGSVMNFTTPGPANPTKPTVSISGATSVGTDKATLVGKINPQNDATEYWFEYSTDSLLGSIIGSGTDQQTLSPGNDTKTVQAPISNLSKNTKYYYRLNARNSYGTTVSSTGSFTTHR